MSEGLELSSKYLRCAHINGSSRNSAAVLPRTPKMVTDAVNTILSFSGQGELVGEPRSVLKATHSMSQSPVT